MPLNTEYYQKRAQELENQQGNYQKVKWYKWKPGRNTIRLLPPFDPRYVEQSPNMTGPLPEGARDIFHVEIEKCFNVGPNRRVVTLDPKKPGPVEEYIDYLNTVGDAVSKAQADKMTPKRRGLCWIVDRDNEIEGVQCLDWPMTEFRNLINLVSDPEWSNLTDPFNGIDLMIDYTPQDKSPTGFASWGAIMPKRNSTPLTSDATFWHEWLKTDHFEETTAGKPTDPEYIKACLAGTDKEFRSQAAAAAGMSPVGTAPGLPPGGALPTVTHPFSPQEKFWMSMNNQTVETTAADIANHVLVGQDVTIMPYDQQKPWGPASTFGFQLVQPVAPAPPPAMPAVSAPPAASPVPAPPAQAPAATTPQLPAAPVPVPAPPPQQAAPAQPPTQPPMPQEPTGGEVPFEQPPAAEAQQSQVGKDLRAALGG
jgi:hypothetical protein